MFRKTIFLMDEAKLTSNKHIYQPISVNEKASSWAHNSQLSIIWEMSLSRQLIMSGNKSVAHSWPFASWGDNSLSKFMMFRDILSLKAHKISTQRYGELTWWLFLTASYPTTCQTVITWYGNIFLHDHFEYRDALQWRSFAELCSSIAQARGVRRY